MDAQERFLQRFSSYHITWRSDMPDRLSGLNFGKDIFINKQKPYRTQTTIIAEEVGHAVTGVGDITKYETSLDLKQEQKARWWGMQQLVSLDDLIREADSGYDHWYDIAEDLEITPEYLQDCVDGYRDKYGEHFFYDDYEFDLSHGLRVIPR